ncbi:hypothetical protein JIN84_08470 [Luteolibacter yonseiensis]|uniref:Novel STAND NTPase 1 domain-containing protein n=2 Tax=Luteolibacter yonseiensis TaxID=1144680 RepID=A0A934V715_9BACT|nr:hypothetical protein [Luteolibacter yonseiensis]MBK1815647.1 hypothetical protein [Luteolibacter yonseiensis]
MENEKSPLKLSIFISSPGDVMPERRIAERVIERVDAAYGSFVCLEPYFWEYEPMVVTKDYQEQIKPPSGFDIFICILWSRLGTRLHSRYTLPPDHQKVAASGTEYEFVDAKTHFDISSTPDILVWLNKTEPLVSMAAGDLEEKRNQYEALKIFLNNLTRDNEELVLKGALNRYGTLDEFEHLLEIKLSKLIESRMPEAGVRKRPRPHWNGNPFRGLGVFEFWHAPIYFGRTAAIQEVTGAIGSKLQAIWQRRAMLAEHPELTAVNGHVENAGHHLPEEPCAFTLIFGSSGSGKSSLVRAGVLPFLAPDKHGYEKINFWRCAVMKPSEGGGDLMKALAHALVQEEVGEEDPEERLIATMKRPAALPELLVDGKLTVAEIARSLENDPKCAIHIVRGGLSISLNVLKEKEKEFLSNLLTKNERDGRTEDAAATRKQLEELKPRSNALILVLDQFEEIFTGGYSRDAVERFLSAIESMAVSGDVVVIATLRSEFFKSCEGYDTLIRLKKNGSTIHLTSPRPMELGKMLTHPAQMGGLFYEENESFGNLDQRILNAAAQDPDSLAMLEFSLAKLYATVGQDRCLKHDEYTKLGELSGILSNQADEVLAENKSCAHAMDSVISLIITVGGRNEKDDLGQTALVRRSVRFSELRDIFGAEELVNAFVEKRLFTTDQDHDGERVFSVTHETLLRRWERIKNWYSDDMNRRFVRVRSWVAERLKQWEESARDDSTGVSAGGDPGFLLKAGKELDDAREQFEAYRIAFSVAEQNFIESSLMAAEEDLWRHDLAEGDIPRMVGRWQLLGAQYQEMRDRVIRESLASNNAGIRKNAAFMLGMIPRDPLHMRLVTLLLEDGDDTVRSAAAYSLVQLQTEEYYDEVFRSGPIDSMDSNCIGSLARLVVTADMRVESSVFDGWFRRLPALVRGRTRIHSWGLRLRKSLPMLITVVVPALFLSAAGGMTCKIIPGALNYAFGQALPGWGMSFFHGAVAAILIGGGSAFGITLHRMVFGREHGKFGFFRPFGSIVAGAVFGGFGGFLCDMAVVGVFLLNGLQIMGLVGWDAVDKPPFLPFLKLLFLENKCGWVFVLNGAGVGIGMAIIANRLRAHPAWENLLQSAVSMGSIQQAFDTIASILRISIRYILVLFLTLAITSSLGLTILHFSGSMTENPEPWTRMLYGGMEKPKEWPKPGANATAIEIVEYKANMKKAMEDRDQKLWKWKISRFGRIAGVSADALTKAVGGFCATVGMAFGLIVLYTGINVDRWKRVG